MIEEPLGRGIALSMEWIVVPSLCQALKMYNPTCRIRETGLMAAFLIQILVHNHPQATPSLLQRESTSPGNRCAAGNIVRALSAGIVNPLSTNKLPSRRSRRVTHGARG